MRVQEVEGGHISRREEALYIFYISIMTIFRGFYLKLEATPTADFTHASKLCR